jgi:hypothetical protein
MRLRCCLCEKIVGACIQCDKKGCIVAYHATCAQKKLEMRSIAQANGQIDIVVSFAVASFANFVPKSDFSVDLLSETHESERRRCSVVRSLDRAVALQFAAEVEKETSKIAIPTDVSATDR